jgi:hypothetical protein
MEANLPPQKPIPPTSSFTWRLQTTDGSFPLDLFEDSDGSGIYQEDNLLTSGKTLLEVWNNYLHALATDAAPVEAKQLAAMWEAYDSQSASLHRPALTDKGDPAHGCECCDGEDICTCPHKNFRAKCLACGGNWPECANA